MADDAWKVLPHDAIEKLAENLWRVRGTLPRMSLKRVMTVVRLGDGRLVLHSAIALDEPSMQALEAWGTPALLIVPNRFHRLDAARYKKRYPSLRVLAPAGAHQQVSQVVPVDGDDRELADPAARVEPLAGIGDYEHVLVVRSADGVTLVFCDAVFNMGQPRTLGARLVTRLMGSAPGPRISRLFKLAGVKDKKALRADLERLAATPGLVRVIVAHDRVAAGPDAAQALRRAATFL